jgi:hypothetical protein
MAGGMYIGGGGTNPISTIFAPKDGNPPTNLQPQAALPVGTGRTNPLLPAPAKPQVVPPQSILGAEAVRPTGDAQGYDRSYLQNLATSIGGLFSRPQGNLSFNPLGNLNEVSPSSGMEGNAPLPGAPSTWLQDALNGLGFTYTPPAPKPPVRTGPTPRPPIGKQFPGGRGLEQ